MAVSRRLLSRGERFVLFSSIISALTALTFLALWFTPFAPISAWNMKFNSGVGCLSLAIALFAVTPENSFSTRRQILAMVASGLAIFIGAGTLFEYATHLNIGIDQLVVLDLPKEEDVLMPGRPAPNTAFGMLILGVALFLVAKRPKGRAQSVPHFLAILAMVIGTLAFAGYLNAAATFYKFGAFLRMSIFTAMLLSLLGLGTLVSRCRWWPISEISGDSLGSYSARRLLFPAIALSISLGWLRLKGQSLGLYETGTAATLFTVTFGLVFVFLIWWNARALNIAERARLKSEAELTYTRAQLAAILDATTDFVGMADAEGRSIYINEAGCRILGVEKTADWENRPISEFHPDWAFEKVANEGIPQATEKGVWRGETALLRADGSEVPMSQVIVVHKGSDGLVRFISTIARDISEEKKMERALRRSAEELVRSNEELARFAYVASHDLQEPLRAISSYLQLLDRRYGKTFDEDAQTYIRFVVDAATRMKQLIDDLLKYSRIGTQPSRFEMVDLDKVIRNSLENLRVSIDESKAKITWEPMPHVYGHAVQLEQLFQNLIGNAIKYRKGEPEISIQCEISPRVFSFSIKDNGIGFEMKHAKQIFDPFRRLHGREEYSGTGIGLAVCKRIVELHGGNIWAESQPGQGSTFHFTLRAKAVEEKPAPQAIAAV